MGIPAYKQTSIDIGKKTFRAAVEKDIVFHCVKCDIDVVVRVSSHHRIEVDLGEDGGYIVGVICPNCGLPHMKIGKKSMRDRVAEIVSVSTNPVVLSETLPCKYCGGKLTNGNCDNCGGPNG